MGNLQNQASNSAVASSLVLTVAVGRAWNCLEGVSGKNPFKSIGLSEDPGPNDVFLPGCDGMEGWDNQGLLSSSP